MNTAEFKFLQPKQLSADLKNILYDWPATPEIEIIDISLIFYGPTKPQMENSMFRLVYEAVVSNLFNKEEY